MERCHRVMNPDPVLGKGRVCVNRQIKIALFCSELNRAVTKSIFFKDVLKFVLTACLYSLLSVVMKPRHHSLSHKSFQFVLGFACVQVREEDTIQCTLQLFGLALI